MKIMAPTIYASKHSTQCVNADYNFSCRTGMVFPH